MNLYHCEHKDIPKMPNLVTTACTIKGPKIDRYALVELMIHQGESGPCFDFGRILPMPAELNSLNKLGFEYAFGLSILAREGFDGAAKALKAVLDRYGLRDPLDHVLENDVEVISRLKHDNPSRMEEALWALAAYKTTGYVSSVEWRQHNWGASSNACKLVLHLGPKVLRFHFTSDAFPEPVFTALADRFPNLPILCTGPGCGSSGEKRYNFPDVDSPCHSAGAAQAWLPFVA